MLFIIILAVAIATLCLYKYCDDYDYEALSIINFTIGFTTGLIAIAMLIVLSINYSTKSVTETKWNERYNALNYQIENHLYSITDRNALIRDVTEWNEDIESKKIAKKSFWIGIFNPENIEGLDKIELDRIK